VKGIVQINVRVESDQRRLFKKLCVDAGVSMASMVAMFIAELVSGRLVFKAAPPYFSSKESE